MLSIVDNRSVVSDKGGRWFDACLRADGWSSGYRSVKGLLDHLMRRTEVSRLIDEKRGDLIRAMAGGFITGAS